MAGIISEATKERIRAANDIVDVIGSYLPLKRLGANFHALCPFHKEKSPSFTVNTNGQFFYCFGCHKGGDVFKFVQDYENIDFPEVLKRLAERARIPIEYEKGSGEDQARHLKEKLVQIHEQITVRWQHALANEGAGQIARDYLAKRGVTADAIKLFRLGFAPDQWDDTVNWAKSKGHELALVERGGLILRKEGSDGFYDRFRGRLMFPICDEQGRVIGFSGRILAGDEKTGKYVNSPETPIFTKSKVFFGLDKSRRALLDAGHAVICEGQLDLIACYMNGVQNVVAPQGTAFTADHARILRRHVEEVVLCFDGDNAGQNATARALDHLLESGLAARVAVVPSPHDPDSFIKAHGGPAFKQLIAQAEGFFDFYLNRLCAANDANTDRGRLAILRAMAEATRKTANAVLIDTYAQKTALRLGVAPAAVRAEFAKSSTPKPARPTPVEPVAPSSEATLLPRPHTIELWLLKLLFRHEELVDWAVARLELQWVQHPLVRQIVSRRFEAHRGKTWRGIGPFLSECEASELQSLVAEASAEDRPLVNPEKQLMDFAIRLRNMALDRDMGALRLRSNQPGMTEADHIAILQQQQELRALKSQPIA